MKNRWFHAPELHSPGHGEERRVEWLELFYDLIYVATIIQLGNALSHHVSWDGFAAFAGLFVPIWFTWTGFTFYSNRFVVDDFLHRGLVFLQMFAIGAMAVCIPEVFEGEAFGFAIAYGCARLVLVALYFRTYLQVESAREMTGWYSLGFFVGALVWLSSAFVPEPWAFLMWGVAMAIDFAVPLNRRARKLVARFPPDVLHMSERYGLLTIIVLGESFVKILTSVSEQGAATEFALMGVMAVAVVCSLWWIYFDDVAGSHIKTHPLAPFAWVYTHLPLMIGVTAVAVGVKKLVLLDPMATAPAKYRWLLCGTLALVFLSVAAIDYVTERRVSEVGDRTRVNVRLVTALVVVLLAPAGVGFDAWLFAAAVAVVVIADVIIDLATAPLAADGETIEHGAQAAFGIGDVDDKTPEGPARRDISEAVRKGTPNELRRDLYFHFMEGSWTQLFAAMLGLYVLTNVIFAALFMLEPGGVVNVRPRTFLDAFSFSVQTMTTIGYGTMTPASTYAHVLVIVEAAVGLLGVAVATGLIFAKLARPTSSVLWSRPVVVTQHEGRTKLMFRVGNARGNDVVEATMRVIALVDEVSPEGLKMRRMRDLKLMRHMSPMFALSWTVMHVIDEDSPLWGIPVHELPDHVIAIVATMTGYDSTYAQTTHSRHIYYPENIRCDEHFVDVISSLDDGRLMVDYDMFHTTRPDELDDDEEE